VTGYDLVLHSRRVVLPAGERPAAVCIHSGRIAAVEEYGSRPGEDLGDLALLPGLVDTHVHVNEPGRTEWEGFATATRAAAAGGVTTILDMPLNSIPPTTSVEALETKRRAAQGQCAVDVGFWGGAVPGNVADLRPLYDAGVFGFKCFLVDSGVPEFPPLDGAQLDEALAAVQGLFVVHAEDPELLRPLPSTRRYADFVASRPDAGEARAAARAIGAANRAGARVHLLHVSSAAPVVGPLHAARMRGEPHTAETCPHYLTLAAEDVPDGATEFKCCPPVRGASDRESLWRFLAEGRIDCVVSDHSPCPPDLKHPGTGDFAAAWGGIASLQLGLPLVWTGARRRGHGLADVVRWMAQRPAEIVGLARKGSIEVGYDADLVAFAPDGSFVVEPSALRHRHPVTPYAGRTLSGVVTTTWLRGEPVDPAGPPRGRLLSRGDA
jgi:allantoinase